MNGNQQPPLLSQPKKSTWLWVVLGAVSVIVLVFALYYYYSAYYAPTDYGPIGSVSTEEKDLSAIEGGLQAESLDGLGAELGDIEKELSQ